MRYQFDPFEFVPDTLELFKNGQRLHLQRQPALVLRILLERPGALITRDRLREYIWGDDRHVDVDRSVAYCLRQIRVTLDDDPSAPRYVETLRGLGYRFVGSVQVEATEAIQAPARSLGGNSTVALGPAVDWRKGVLAVGSIAVAVAVAIGLTSPQRHDSVLARADAFITRGARGQVEDVKVALAVYNRVLADSPSSSLTMARALAGVATAESMLANHHRDLRAAQAALLKAIEAARLAPENPDVLTGYARSLHAAGRLEEAAQVYRSVLESDSDRTVLLTDWAAAEFQRGRFDTAVRLLTQQWNAGPPDADSADLLAVVLTQLGFDSSAHEWSQLARDLFPDNRRPGFLKALNAYRAGRLAEAEGIIEPLLAEPDPGARVVSLGALVGARRRGVNAVLPGLVTAAATLPHASNVRTLLADAYRATGRQEDERRERAQVLEICQRGVTLAPQSPLWARCLASQLVLADDVDAAVFWYDRAVDLGWRQLQSDRADGWLTLIIDDPRVTAIQGRMQRDLDQMRAAVIRAGLPKPLSPPASEGR